jgi:N-acetylmuramoyl-L-alanine amidase
MLKRVVQKSTNLVLLVLFLFSVQINTTSATSLKQLQWPLYENAACSAATTGDSAPPAAADGSDNVGSVFMYLTAKGLSKDQAAGVIGNLQWESADLKLDPTKTQGGGHSNTVPNDNSTGYGIAQWTITSRKQGLINYAHSINKPVSSIEAQEGYLWKELKDNPGYDLKGLQAASTYQDATTVFMQKYERPKVNNPQDRIPLAKDVLERFKDITLPTTDPSSNFEGCSCSAIASPSASGKVVVLDPGHSVDKKVVDAATGLNDVDSSNTATGERQAVWDVAQKAKTKLEADGYKVILTKSAEDQYAGMRDRAKVADQAKADIAVSIHGDPGLADDGQIYVQKNGLFRGSGDNKTVFNNSDLADKSQKYAALFKTDRERNGGGNVVIKDNSFDGRDPIEPGNIPLVMLFSKSTPWVYNESKMPFDHNKYAAGIVEGIEKSIGRATATGAPSGAVDATCPDSASAAGSGDAIATAFNFAYPDGRKTLTMKATYATAIKAAQRRHEYVGGTKYPGIDCGGFITRIMRDSGADKDYNAYQGPTSQQQKYMDDHPEKYQKIGPVINTGKLQPGDIAITDNHTYMYVGPESSHPSFKGNAASASWDDYAPTANNTYFADTHSQPFDWYRLIK